VAAGELAGLRGSFDEPGDDDLLVNDEELLD
jgi:hypothetical protein